MFLRRVDFQFSGSYFEIKDKVHLMLQGTFFFFSKNIRNRGNREFFPINDILEEKGIPLEKLLWSRLKKRKIVIGMKKLASGFRKEENSLQGEFL